MYLVLNFTESDKALLESKETVYNNFQQLSTTSTYDSLDIYSGWLVTEVVQHICLNSDGLTITIPYIPEALINCIFTKVGIQSLNTGGNKIKVGADVNAAITVKDPWGRVA